MKPKARNSSGAGGAKAKDKLRCGLCGKTANLTRTPCCGQWICDDEHNYQLFSYVRNSCFRNHSRYTLCAAHYNEGHEGNWQDCPKCREMFETEMYVWYGTNEYNFEKLKNPPSYEPTKCADCGRVIRLAYDGHSYGAGGYRCMECSDRALFAEKAPAKKRRKKTKNG